MSFATSPKRYYPIAAFSSFSGRQFSPVNLNSAWAGQFTQTIATGFVNLKTPIWLTAFRLDIAYKMLAAEWDAGQVVPLFFNVITSGAGVVSLPGVLMNEVRTVTYNAAVEAYITETQSLREPVLISPGLFPYDLQLLINVLGPAGHNGNVWTQGVVEFFSRG